MVSIFSGLCVNSWIGGLSSVCDIFVKKIIVIFILVFDKYLRNKLFVDLK